MRITHYFCSFPQAACDLSDIQCAAALIHSGDVDSSVNPTDRATSMNPFPGSTRGYPKSEEEIQRLEAEEEIRATALAIERERNK